MCAARRFTHDYLLIYDPDHVEEHDETTDFEFTNKKSTKFEPQYSLTKQPVRRSKNGKGAFRQRLYKSRNYSDEYVKAYQCNKSSKELLWQTRTTHTSTTVDQQRRGDVARKGMFINERKDECRNSGRRKTDLNTNDPKRALSCFIKRPLKHIKYMETIDEKRTESTSTSRDSSSQTCNKHKPKQSKQYFKRQQYYTVQPVYAIEGHIHRYRPQVNHTKITKATPAKNMKILKNQSCGHSLDVSSSSEIYSEENSKRIKIKKRLQQKNQTQQFPSPATSGYHAFASQHSFYQKIYDFNSDSNIIESACCSDIISRKKSRLWNYLSEKMSRKKINAAPQKVSTCAMLTDAYSTCSPDNCVYYKRISQAASNTVIKQSTKNDIKPDSQFGKSLNFGQRKEVQCQCSTRSEDEKNRLILCMCNNTKQCQTSVKRFVSKDTSVSFETNSGDPEMPEQASQTLLEVSKRAQCQEPHHALTQRVAQRYNREILCVHNPPCVLINGCLNLPPPKFQAASNSYPVFLEPNTSYTSKGFNIMDDVNNKNEFYEKCCQYQNQCLEACQWQSPDQRVEQTTQCACQHDPPCAIVPTCVKKKPKPTLESPFSHFPMHNTKWSDCVMQNANKYKPQYMSNAKLGPKNYTVLTARENVSTQMNPKHLKMFCRHHPQCVMIPKCLERTVRGGCVESSPECAHQPSCEMLPACCRQRHKMVSVQSQNPRSSCSIV